MANLWTLLSVMLVLWTISFLFFHRYLSRRTSAERILSELRDEVDRMVREIDAITDRDVALVEERVKSLRGMLEEMDKRILSYRRETDRQLVQERAYAELGRTVPRTKYAQAGEAAPAPSAPRNVPSDNNEPSLKPAPKKQLELPVSDQASVAPAVSSQNEQVIQLPRIQRAAVRIEPKSAPFAERVAELYNAGFSADLIANKLKSSVAEVDLAIELANRLENHGPDTGN